MSVLFLIFLVHIILASKQVYLSMDTEEISGWPDLPQCLLELILEHLILSDSLCFDSIFCLSGCTAKAQCLYSPAHQLPSLIFCKKSSTERSIEFFCYKVLRPDCGTPMDCVLCVSSFHGWVVF